jgi:uncharacterized membrane protein YbhN (UPF0104 family)
MVHQREFLVSTSVSLDAMNYITSEQHFQPHVRIRKWFYRSVFWVLSLLILVALLRQADWRYTYAQLVNTPTEVLLICALGWLCSFLFRAIRFQAEWKDFGKISMGSALRLTFIHNAAVVLVPFRVGELGYPVLVRQLLNVSWQQCIRSLLWLRFQDGVVLMVLALLLLPFFSPELRMACLLFGIGAVLFLKPWWMRVLRSRHFVVRQLRAFLHQRSNAWGWFWSVANWSVKLFAVALLLQSLTGLLTVQTMRGALTGELSALLPLTGPAGFGTYEAGVWAGLSLPWLDMKNLMASVFISHLFFLMISLLGAVFFLVLEVFQPTGFNVSSKDVHG